MLSRDRGGGAYFFRTLFELFDLVLFFLDLLSLPISLSLELRDLHIDRIELFLESSDFASFRKFLHPTLSL